MNLFGLFMISMVILVITWKISKHNQNAFLKRRAIEKAERRQREIEAEKQRIAHGFPSGNKPYISPEIDCSGCSSEGYGGDGPSSSTEGYSQ